MPEQRPAREDWAILRAAPLGEAAVSCLLADESCGQGAFSGLRFRFLPPTRVPCGGGVRGFGSGDMPLRQQFLRAPSGIRVLVKLSSDTSNHKLTRAAWGSQFLGMKESAEVHSIVQS